MSDSTRFFFFIGTEAELIKLFPVLNEFSKKGIAYSIIASGQNDISKSRILSYLKNPTIEIFLSKKPITQTPVGVFVWFMKNLFSGHFLLRKEIGKSKDSKEFFIVHGDTVSTVMGALLGKSLGYKVAHIEAGLRSFNLLHPFPEELDRVITSFFVDVHFCPNTWAQKNLQKRKGVKIITKENTLLDSLRHVLHQGETPSVLKRMKKKKYFVFVMHRQENIYNETRVRSLIAEVEKQVKKLPCIFILHKPTELALTSYSLLKRIEKNEDIHITPRLPYEEFMKVLYNSEFIITDGGSNQEESYYMGKPCLVLRSETERIEGVDKNVVISKNNLTIIRKFIQKFEQYKRAEIAPKIQPSKIIADYFNTL